MTRLLLFCLLACLAISACDASKPSVTPSQGGDPIPANNQGMVAQPKDSLLPPLPDTGIAPKGQQNSPKTNVVDRTNLTKDCYDMAKADSKMLCPDLYEPVCGCDGANYSNECAARKMGVLKFTAGRCK